MVDVGASLVVLAAVLGYLALSDLFSSGGGPTLGSVLLVFVAFVWIPLAAHFGQSRVTPRFVGIAPAAVGWSASPERQVDRIRREDLASVSIRGGNQNLARAVVWVEFGFRPGTGPVRRRYLAVSATVAEAILQWWDARGEDASAPPASGT